jgi:hypothetical protein
MPAEDDDGEKAMTRTTKATKPTITSTPKVEFTKGTTTGTFTVPGDLTSITHTNGYVAPVSYVSPVTNVSEMPKTRTSFRKKVAAATSDDDLGLG